MLAGKDSATAPLAPTEPGHDCCGDTESHSFKSHRVMPDDCRSTAWFCAEVERGSRTGRGSREKKMCVEFN